MGAPLQYHRHRTVDGNGIRRYHAVVSPDMNPGSRSLPQRRAKGRMGNVIGGKMVDTEHLDDEK